MADLVVVKIVFNSLTLCSLGQAMLLKLGDGVVLDLVVMRMVFNGLTLWTLVHLGQAMLLKLVDGVCV